MPRREAPRQPLSISLNVKLGGVFWTKFEHQSKNTASWENGWDGREAEGGSLENYYRSNPIEGSNPSPTAKFYI